MLAAVVIALRPLYNARLPITTGPATQAWFLDQVRTYDPGLAELLHTPNEERPYTTSGILVPRAKSSEHVSISSSETVLLRVTSLAAPLTTLLLTRIVPRLAEQIRLVNMDFRVEAVATQQQQHKWAGVMTYDDLLQVPTVNTPRRPSLNFQFMTPALFRSQGTHLLFPEARLVFGGLARRWNQFAPLLVPSEFEEFAMGGIGVSSYELATQRVRFGARGAFSGFYGRCRYAFLGRDEVLPGWAYRLRAFATFAGVGWRTAMGLGQVQCD